MEGSFRKYTVVRDSYRFAELKKYFGKEYSNIGISERLAVVF
jgi:hypothetical protein